MNRPAPRSDFYLLAGAGLGFVLGGLWGHLLGLTAMLVWTLRAVRPPRGKLDLQRSLIGAVAILALAAGLIRTWAPPSGHSESWHRSAYAEIWEDLADSARQTAARVQRLAATQADGDAPKSDTDDELADLFAALETHHPLTSVFLIRSAGQVVAWSGPSLPVDPGREGGAFAAALPTRGGAQAFVRPASVTLTSTVPLGEQWRGWLVTAARSFNSSRVPWAEDEAQIWSVAPGRRPAPPGIVAISAEPWPDLWLASQSSTTASTPRWLQVTMALALVAALWIPGASPQSEHRPRPMVASWPSLMVTAAVALYLFSASVWVAVAWIMAAMGVPLLRMAPLGAQLAVGAGLAVAGGWTSGMIGGSVAIPGFPSMSEGVLALIAGAAYAVGVLRPGREKTQSMAPRAWLGVLIVALAIGAAWLDVPVVALLVAAVAGIAILSTASGSSRVPLMLLLATWVTLLWTGSERLAQSRRALTELDRTAAATPDELVEMNERIRAKLEDFDILSLSLGQTALGSVEALAFGVWQASPLNHRDLNSYATVLGEETELSTYERGLLTAQGPTEASGESAGGSGGVVRLLLGGSYFADLEYAWQPVNGWALRRLLAGAQQRSFEPAVLTTLPNELDEEIDSKSPGLWNNSFNLLSPDRAFRLELAALAPGAATERVAGRVALCFVVLGLFSLLSQPGFGKRGLREQIQAWRQSFPRRLALTLGGLILIPLLVLNLALLTLYERSLADQRDRLETGALEAARRTINNYVETVSPNFALATYFNDDLLAGVSQIVARDADLYWDSGLYATSRRFRFASGEVGSRLPAEVYSALVLDGAPQVSHSNPATGERSVYAPLNVNLGTTGPRFILAVPVTAQLDLLTEAAQTLRARTLLIALAILLLGLWATRRATQGFSRPVLEMIAGTERIAGGAESLGIAMPDEGDLGRLASAIDKMAADISVSQRRERVERELLERILANVATAVVLVRSDGKVSRVNRAGEELLGVGEGDNWSAVIRPEMKRIPASGPDDDASGQRWAGAVDIDENGEERSWNVAALPVERHGGDATLWVVEDVTDIVRGERLAAWAEMARIVAHEIKNPLTPIRLSAEHLREVFRQDDTVDRCTANILRQVEDLRLIANEFSEYSRRPELELERFDAIAWGREIVDSYRAQGGEVIVMDGDRNEIELYADRRLLTRVLRNLIENALRVANGSPVEIEIREADGRQVQVEVKDRGPGVPQADLDRIFEPYFSTHATGTGLGLPISKRIVESHGGKIEAVAREGGGLRVLFRLPIDPAAESPIDTSEVVE